MTAEWIPLHRSLRQGNKRGLPRAVRFVYLELTMEARPFAGRLPLPRGFRTDVDRVHDVLGGNRREVALALSMLTVPLDVSDPTDEPMIELSGPDEHRVLAVKAYSAWVKQDLSTTRVRKFRNKQSELSQEDAGKRNAFRSVSETPDETLQIRGEERREEERRSERVEQARSQASDATPTAVATRTNEKRKATRLPEDWEPSPELVDRLRRELRVDPIPAVRDFVGYWVNATRNAVKPRWDLAFENWVRKDAREDKLPAWEPTRPGRTVPRPILDQQARASATGTDGAAPKTGEVESLFAGLRDVGKLDTPGGQT